MNYTEQKERIQSDPSASFWLRKAIDTLDGRDPVDSLKDADTLHTLQTMRLEELLNNQREG